MRNLKKFGQCLGVCFMWGSGLYVTVLSGNAHASDASSMRQSGMVESATDAPRKDLAKWVAQVLERHPELLQAESESRQAEFRVKEAQAARWPQTTFSSNRGRESQHIALTGRTIDYNQQQQYQLKGVLPLLDKGIDAQIQQREALASRADWSLTDVREQLTIRTVELYIEVVRHVRLMELARENLKVHRAYVAQMKDIARIDLGRAADLPMAQSRVALAESALISRIARLESARVQWSAHTGLPAPDLMTGSNTSQLQNLQAATLPETLELAVSNAIESSPQLQKNLADIAAAKGVLASAKAIYHPKINAEARMSAGKNYGSVLGNQNAHYIGIGLDWTLPLNPGRSYANRAAEEGVIGANHARESMSVKLKASVEAQWYTSLASQHYLKAFEQYVSSAEQAVQGYREQFKIGRRSLLDVLNAENELFTARTNVASAQQDIALSSWILLGLRGLASQELGL